MKSDTAGMPPISAADGIAPGASRSWWRMTIVLLASSLAGVMLWIVAAQSNRDWFYSLPSITVRGDAFQLVRGSGRPAESTFIVGPAPAGITAISTSVAPFPADKYTRVEWVMRSAQFPKEVSFAWRTRERGNRNFSLPMQRLTEGFAPLKLAGNDEWRGTITGVALIVHGPVVAPMEIASVRLSSGSAPTIARETLAEWTEFIPLKGYSIAFPFDSERGAYFSVAKAVAIATGLAIIAYLLIARRRQAVDTRVLWGIFAGAWLLLDVRWQANVFRQVAVTAERFAGKTSEEKLLSGEGSDVVALVNDVKALLPPPPARVLFLCDVGLIGLRGAYLLYPHNAFHDAGLRKSKEGVGALDYQTLRSGDYVVLYFYSRLGYDFEKQLLVWPDGHTVPAELMLSRANTLMVRIK